jgi:hypothetical protein
MNNGGLANIKERLGGVLDRSIFTIVAFIAVGCAAVQPTSNKSLARELWTSPDGTEFFSTYRDKGLGLYLNNNVDRTCYSYIIPGRWLPTNESALLQGEDGEAYAGVILYSEQELKDFEGPDLVTRAARLITKVYEKRIGRPLASVKLEPFDPSGKTKWGDTDWSSLLDALRKEVTSFESSRPGAMKWTAAAHVERAGQQFELQDSKIFVEITPGWVAQISAGTTASWPPFDDELARSILETLSATSDPECYKPFIRKYFPNIR